MQNLMKNLSWDRPFLVLNCKIGALAIMRSLGPLGVPIFGIDADPGSPTLRSRYLKKHWIRALDPNAPGDYLSFVMDVGKEIGGRPILVPTSDDLSMFVAEFGDQLSQRFDFPRNTPELVENLADKRRMFSIASEHGVATPNTVAPRDEEHVRALMTQFSFPIMLKGIDGRLLQARKGKRMVIVQDQDELLHWYRFLEDPEAPNLLLQEMIPGGDDQVYIFNGYFNAESECLAGFTGRKIRQYPVHTGAASLGICEWYQDLADITCRLMKGVGYTGILDIGYRLDPRDGQYKVLDINPRVGQAFRLFVAENDMDVIKSLYLDMTGQQQPPVQPREGRKWLIEDFDVVSSFFYHREGALSVSDWIRSFRGVEEAAWFSSRDPLPFLHMGAQFLASGFGSLGRQIRRTLTGVRSLPRSPD